jgi:hypothetical protein
LIEYVNDDIFSELFYGVTGVNNDYRQYCFCFTGSLSDWRRCVMDIQFYIIKKQEKYFGCYYVSCWINIICGAGFYVFSMHTLIPKNNSSSEYGFSKIFIRLDKEFTEIYKSNKKPVVVINVEIIGYINGKLLIIHQPYKRYEGSILEPEEKIYEKLENMDW